MTERREALYVEPVSLDLAWKDPGKNLRLMEDSVKARLARSPAAPPKSRIFLFPELALTGFVTQEPLAFKVEPPDEAVEGLRRIASRYKTAIAAGFPEVNPEDKSRPLNALVLIAPDGGIVAKYHKMHLFTVGKNPESAGYAAGESGTLCRYRGWNIGFAVCFDLRFPGLFHEYAKAGADLLLVASCWIGGPHKSEQYRTLNSAYAVLAQAYVATVNRSGKDPFYEYDGSEYVFSPMGENVYQGKACRLDPAVLESCRKMRVRGADRDSYRILHRMLPGENPVQGL